MHLCDHHGVLTIFLLTCAVYVRAAIDVAGEINRIEASLGKFKAPPELIESMIDQVQTHCKKNRTIDQGFMNSTGKCLEKHFNQTQLMTEIKESIPEGKLDNVFHNICVKWPKVKECLSEIFLIIDDCWQKGDHVTKFVDGFVNFFCGDDNDGARIALFFAEGGLKCLEEHGDSVKMCIEKKQPLPETIEDLQNISPALPPQDEICRVIEEAKECTTKGLKCEDPTPENLISAMLINVGKSLECKVSGSLASTAPNAASQIMLVDNLLLACAVNVFLRYRLF